LELEQRGKHGKGTNLLLALYFSGRSILRDGVLIRKRKIERFDVASASTVCISTIDVHCLDPFFT